MAKVVRICSCGRVHVIKREDLYKAIDNGKEYAIICARCGRVTLMGADDAGDELYMYTHTLPSHGNYSITEEMFKNKDEHKGVEEILYSNGYGITMMTGRCATSYSGRGFRDESRPYFDEFIREGYDINDVKEAIDKYIADSETVNMKLLIKEFPNDVLVELSKLSINGLNWKGTVYQTEYNSK